MNRRGFTLIELLIAIAVIAVLLGLIVLGLGLPRDKAKADATRLTMDTLKGMLERMRQANNLRDMPVGSLTAPGTVTEGNPDRLGPAVQRTRIALSQLIAIPENRSILEKLSHDQLMPVPGNPVVPVLKDGWGNPILYVPGPNLVPGGNDMSARYGFIIVVPGSGETRRIISPASMPYPTSGSTNDPVDLAQRLGKFKPFWASAGPDGMFNTPNDNVYSHEN